MAPTGALTVTCSAGVSLIKAMAGEDVVVQADQAMFQRKRQGQAVIMPRADVTGRAFQAGVELPLDAAAGG